MFFKRRCTFSRKISQLNYELSGKCRRLSCLQKSLYDLNNTLKKTGKKQK